MKKALAVGLATLMGASVVLAGCGSSSSSSSSGGSSSSGKSIRVVNNKVEIDEGLKAAAAAYEEESGVSVEIESLGGGVDTQATLKSYYQAGNMPDIFVFEGDKDYGTWEGRLADLSDEAWVSDVTNDDALYRGEDGNVYGFPMTTEAIGLAYNKEILDKAGIDPASITGPESMKAAFETLDSQKDSLGLTAVVGYCTEASQLYWSTGQHLWGTYLDEGLARDDTTYIDEQLEGKFDDQRISDWATMVELFNQYSDPDLLVSGTYDNQILNFASGKYAFVTQGSWIGNTIVTTDKDAYDAAGDFEIGMVPYAFEEGQDTILTNTPNWWGVYKDGNVDEAKAFLAWLASNDGGQKYLVENCGMVSPYKSCTYVASDPFAQTIIDYTNAGKTSAWHWLKMKDGMGQNATGVVFQEFAKGTYDHDQFVQQLEDAIVNYQNQDT